MFSQFTKLAAVTAAEVVDQSRRTATAAISFIPHDETKDAVAKIVNLQCQIADIYAASIDKSVEAVKKGFAFKA